MITVEMIIKSIKDTAIEPGGFGLFSSYLPIDDSERKTIIEVVNGIWPDAKCLVSNGPTVLVYRSKGASDE